MRVKEAVTKVHMRTIREAGEEKERPSLFPRPQAPIRDSLGAFGSRTRSFAVRICCHKYQLELLAEEASFQAIRFFKFNLLNKEGPLG